MLDADSAGEARPFTATTVEEAINDMASRIQVLSFLSFASSISQAKTLGADIGPTLRSQSELMRIP